MLAAFVKLLHQKAFHIKLLDVDKRRLLANVMRVLLAQIERIHLVMPGKGATYAPLHANGGNAVIDAQSLENFQRFLRIANAAR